MAKSDYLFERTQIIPRPRDEVFAFFQDASNLERITPEFLAFKILTPAPINMQPGTVIDYRLKLFGIFFNWQTEIETFDPSFSFSDVQKKGPYRRWHHTHQFFEVPEGTLMIDTVRYQMPLWCLGWCAHAVFVRRSLDTIFTHRYEVIERELSRADTLATA